MFRTYRAKGVVLAIPLDLDLVAPIQYQKWGSTQTAVSGSFLMQSPAGEVYTCASDAEGTAPLNYAPISDEPGWFRKQGTVEAYQATAAGKIETLEGTTYYGPGDYVIKNPDGDMYAIGQAKFDIRYELVD